MFEQFDFSASSLLKAYCEFCPISSADKMMKMTRARLAIHLTTGAVCYVNLPKSQYQKIKNALFIPALRQVDILVDRDGYCKFSQDYTEERKSEIYKRKLDDYESALRRHQYILLPSRISISDFWNNR